MRFEEALTAMREGKKVYRKSSVVAWSRFFQKYWIEQSKHGGTEYLTGLLGTSSLVNDILGDDWEVWKEE